ncbi:MAG: TonB-dependent receptor, partial [candidate division Zixibacteria bacterium]|nr:TonB-dependent receptor [candidate division Zixibacteria bacterium]
PCRGISHSQIQQSGGIAEVLSVSTGVDVRSYGAAGSVATLSNWGTFNRHMLLLYDGRVVRDYSLGGFNLSEYSAEELDRVEMVKGPQSAYYGSDAIGGVINLIPPSMLVDRMRVSSQFGSFSFGRHHIEASRKIGRFGVGGWAELMRSDNDRSNSGVRQTMFGARIDHLSADSRSHFWLSGRFFNDSVGSPGPVPPASTIPTFGDPSATSLYEHQKDRNYSFDAHYALQINARTQIQCEAFTEHKKLTYYSKWEEFWMTPVDTALGTTTYDKTSSGISGRILRSADSWRLAAGADLLFGSLDYTSTEKTPGGESRSDWTGRQHPIDLWADLAPWTQSRIQPSLSGRLQFIKGRPVQSSYNLGGIAVLSPQWRLKVGYGFAFRLPSLADQFAGTPYTRGNPELQAETSRSLAVSMTARTADDKLRVESVFFRQRVSGLIQYLLDPSTFQYIPLNVDRFQSDGLELGVTLQPIRQLSTEFTSVYQRARQTTGARPGMVDAFYVPKITGSVQADYHVAPRASVGASVRYTSRRWIIMWDSQEKTIRQVYELGLAGSVDLTRTTRLLARIDDLTNQKRPSQFGYSRADGDYPDVGRRLTVRLVVTVQ